MSIRSTGAVGSGRRRSNNMPGPKEKSFAIPRPMVWEAWRQVKANKGAPGVDEVDLKEFEADLRDNLYKVWNRMSSGSYLPPAVRAVEIPKPHGGGVRTLGVPTVSAYDVVVQRRFGFVARNASVSSAARRAAAGSV